MQFIRNAIQGNLAEVKLGQLAQQKGQSDAVRSMGSMLGKQHSKANQEATAVAQKLNVVPPSEPTAAQKATYDRLAKLSGAQFDQEFVSKDPSRGTGSGQFPTIAISDQSLTCGACLTRSRLKP